ncbi:hypothetical protein SAMN05421774_101862 [Gemmobacter megaterium]|uniref:Uncharacterized protein n=1 Tax=Gemmobacter megaterium TaxID=1086013 RepID=A0A1N7L2S2_9RHOB|nr:hypothetical protein GCM10011345_08440 [Gemmobacter megaterium]SIS68077.1 hypothetical protein SAMN05421774_101862 [Gemmobacter megaterium]
MTDWTVAQLDRETMLALGKALEPLPAATLATLAEIEGLSGLDGYVEQDVREEIIAPILRALGYRKESMFWTSAVWRSGSRDAMRSPNALRHLILASILLRA